MNYQVKSNIYKKPDGSVTYSAEEGNELVLVAGAVVSGEEAKRLKLPELDAEIGASIPADAHLSDLKPFEESEPAVEAKLPPHSEGTTAEASA